MSESKKFHPLKDIFANSSKNSGVTKVQDILNNSSHQSEMSYSDSQTPFTKFYNLFPSKATAEVNSALTAFHG